MPNWNELSATDPTGVDWDSLSDTPPPPPKPAGVMRTAGDMAIKGAQGVVDLGASVIGLGNMGTGGLIGKGMDAIGYDPQRTNAAMGEYLSESQKSADQRVQDADGFFETLGQAATEPRFIAGSVMQSLPGLLAMGGAQGAAARAIAAKAAMATTEGAAAAASLSGKAAVEAALATKAGEAAAKAAIEANSTRLMAMGAATEGAQSTGNITQEAQHAGREWKDYAPGAAAAGAGTGLIGFGAGKLMGDAGTGLFTGAGGVTGKLPARMAKAGFSEGVLEEMPQSGQEAYFKNTAMGEADPMQGVGNAAATGLVTGAAMGIGMGAFNGGRSQAPASAKPADPLQIGNTPDPYISFPDGTVAKRSEVDAYINTLPDDQRVAARAKMAGLAPQPVDPIAAIGVGNPNIGLDEAIAATQAAVQSGADTGGISTILAENAQNQPRGLIGSARPATENVASTQAINELEGQNARQAPLPATPDAIPAPGAAPIELPGADRAQPGQVEPAQPVPGAVDGKVPQQATTPAQAPPIEAPAVVRADATGPAAAGATPGNARLEAARIDPRLVPVSKRQTAGAVDAAMMTGDKLNKEWHAFADDSGTLNIPRAEMPQIKAEHRGAMVNFMNARDIAHRQEEVQATSLKPTQTEFSPAKVEKALGFEGPDRSILVSSDNHVLDGHHQWMAKLKAGEPVKVIRLDAPIKQLLKTIKEFPSVEQAIGTPVKTSEQVGGFKRGDSIRVNGKVETVWSIDPAGEIVTKTGKRYKPEQVERAAPPVATLNKDGTLTIKGDPAAIKTRLKEVGLKGMTGKNGVQVGKSQAEKAQVLFEPKEPVAQDIQAQAAIEKVAPEGPVHLGRNNTPLSEGGKPYKTRDAAADAKKLQPMMRVVAVKGGFALAEKTEKQLAAEVKAARRLRNPQTSPAGEPIPAHAFIANEGGLRSDTRADMNVGGNPKMGNRYLFAGPGKGLSMERATARLIEEGYLSEGASHSEAAALIKRSLTKPQYNADGIERIAEAEDQARYDAYLLNQENAVAEIESLDDNEFAFLDDSDIPFGDVPSNASTESAMQAMGFTKEEIQDAITQESGVAPADSQGVRGPVEADASQAQGSAESRAPAQGQDEGLSAPSQQDILDQQARTEAATKAEKAQQRAADELARRERERKDIAKASEAAADTFVLGGDAEQNLSGQGRIFDAPAPKTEAKPAVKQPSTEELRARADLNNALADLGDIFSKPFKSFITPEQEQKLFPVLARVFDAAFRLGYAKFKDAAKFSLDQIRGALGADVADVLTLDHLQGAYIAASSGKPGTDTKRAVIDIEDKSEIESHTAKTDNERNEESNAASTDGRVERDSAESAAEPAVGDAVQDDAGAAAGRVGQDGGPASGKTGRGQQDRPGVPFGSAPVAGERGDQPVSAGNPAPELESILTGSDFREPGGDSGVTGIPPESIPASEVDAVADQGATGVKAEVERMRADKAPVKLADIENIRATLPQLMTGQQDDVLVAEQRFAKPTGYGMLFTNGTGTGKTFTGLGIIKRFARQGKGNTLIVAPDDKIAADWMESGKLLGLNITKLSNTKDAGKGIVITTYANMGENDALATRQWDLVVADEAHTLMQAADGKPTGYLENLRAITHHPDGAGTRYTMLNRKAIDENKSASDKIKENGNLIRAGGNDTPSLRAENVRLEAIYARQNTALNVARQAVNADIKAMQGEKRTRLVALSATPFAYEKTIDWAQGYLFEYKDGYPYDANEAGLKYNLPDPREYFMQTRFGYSMRYNKLTTPDAKVDSGIMQRQFNGELKKSGSLSGRMLDVTPDYDRRFVLVDSAIGNRIDEALAWLSEQQRAAGRDNPGFGDLSAAINDKFKYLEKRYLLEAIKATEVIPIVKQHMAMGRKVVVFHDYKQGGGFNPFRVGFNADPGFIKALAAFNAQFADLVNAPLGSMPAPIEVFRREIPGVLLVNGDEKKADLLKRYKQFQDDSTGPLVMLVQSAKNKGWSGHDTTGRHQRVLINLGQPTAPTLAIQQEGRIYRTGQASDAIMRYLNTGTNWERWTFASTIATRASTAENLGMGEAARALKDSFIQSFEESDAYPPGHEGEGKGGKERDRAANNALTEYDRAKALYFANQKKTSSTKAQEGADYFATPEPIGLKMVEWLDARNGEDELEPSGGHGAIARWFPEKTNKTVIEPSLALRSRLALAMNAGEDRIIDGTFEDHAIVNKYDGIAMNPPFGTAGRMAVDHIAKAATHLRDGGRIVALLPDGPSATAKFDKWFYESSEKPARPLFKADGVAVYKGDTLTMSGFGNDFEIVAGEIDRGLYVRATGQSKSEGVNISAIKRIKPTGARTESYQPAADLHLVASIKLPSVTFERAGTSFNTRIVIIEKQADKAFAPAQQHERDLSDIESTKELFDRLENLTMPKRPKVDAVEPEAATTDKPSKPAKTGKPAPAMAELGATVTLDGKPYEVTTYTTNAGKELRGVWVPTQAQALKHGPSTFQKRPLGWFVRERDLPAQEAPAFSRSTPRTASMAPAQVQSIVDRIAAKWANAPEIIVADNMDDPRIPQSARDEDQKQRSLGAAGNAEGFAHEGKVYLLAGNLTSPSNVAEVLLHESLGHIGLRGVFGDSLKPILQQISTMYKAKVTAKAAQYGLDMNKAEDRLTAAEEVLAELAQAQPSIGFAKRAIAAIRTWLRKNMPMLNEMRLTDDEIIRNILIPARRFIERGERLGSRGRDSFPRGTVFDDESTTPDTAFARSAAGQVAQNVEDALRKATVTDLLKQFGNRLSDFRGLGLQTLGRRQLVEIYSKDLPQLKRYDTMVAQMDADKNESGAEADKLATSWGKLKDERQLAELMHDATLAQIDPDKAYAVGDDRNHYDALKHGFDALTPEARSAYREARDMYATHNEKVRTAIRERIERSELSSAKKQELLKKMDGEFFKKVKGVYFPLARFGQYVTIVKNGAGEVLSVTRSETMNEAEATRLELLKQYPAANGFKVGKVLKDREFNAARDGVGRGFMADLFQTLEGSNAGEELIDSISQLYLAALPDLSWAKHGIHRKGTPGFSQDARRAFAQNMFHGARYLAKLRYADQLQSSLDQMQEHIGSKAEDEKYDSVKAQQVVDEMVKRHDSMMNPQTNPLSTALTSFGYLFHLGLSPASAIVNLSQTAMVAYPLMGAKWGFNKSATALLKASKQAAGNMNDISKVLTGDERKAYDEAVRSGVIDVTMAHDLAGIAQGEDARMSAKLRPVMKAASFMFHHAEKFNRQVTFIAAYRLAREAGTAHEAAYEQAVNATYGGHFDYAQSNRPRAMQGNVARVVLLFKQYAENMIYTLVRNAYQSLKAATPQERQQARKALGGLLVTHAMAAGVFGLPLVGLLLSAASAIGDDDDEPWDAKVALQNMLADSLGQKAAEVFAHGLSRLTPWDISGRVGLDKLLLPDIQEGLEGARAVESWMSAALGPVAGIAVNVGKGAQDMSEGRYMRGLESMLPSALRAPLKAYRFGAEGNIDKTGIALNDEVGSLGVAGQVLGFAPSETRLAQEGKSAIYRADKAIQARRADLVRQYAMAAMVQDEDGKADARKDIARFNEKNPQSRITPTNLLRSVMSRRKRIAEAENGVYLPKKRRDAMDAGRFAEVE